MSDLYAVLGNPIEHSRSPLIHQAFATQTGQDIAYVKHEVPLRQFRAFVDDLRQQGYKGVNVTLPFKIEAFEYADTPTLRAKKAHAANTLKFEGNRVYADNTDGVGLCQDIEHYAAVYLKGKQILLMGAGGAARGVLMPLLEKEPQRLCLINRTESKAIEMLKEMELTQAVEYLTFEQCQQEKFDVIINSTSAGLGSEPTSQWACHLGPHVQLAYDLVYGAHPSAFMQYAKAQQCLQVRDGLGMLVEQAASAFEWWRGIKPDTAPVLKKLRMLLSVT